LVSYQVQRKQLLAFESQSSPDAITVVTITREGEFIMSEHATVEQNKFVAGNSKEGESKEMPERCNFESCVVHCVGGQPRKHFPLRASKRKFCRCPDEVTVTDENSHLIASRHFNFQSIISASLKERAREPDIHFPQKLNESRIKEGVKVGLFVSESQVRVIPGNTIEVNLCDRSERSDEVLCEKLSAFIDLLETDKFEFIRLVGIDAFTVKDVSEKEHEYPINFEIRRYLGGLFGYSLKASCCFAGVPSGSAPAVVEV
jgi:hypothetical protein